MPKHDAWLPIISQIKWGSRSRSQSQNLRPMRGFLQIWSFLDVKPEDRQRTQRSVRIDYCVFGPSDPQQSIRSWNCWSYMKGALVFKRSWNTLIFFSGQALCSQCRDETHRAKMFSKHEVIHMSKKTKDNAKKVSFWADHYISTPVWSEFFLSRGILNIRLSFIEKKPWASPKIWKT